MINVTEKAVEKISAIEKLSDVFLRIYVEGGGCSGMQYKFILDCKDEVDILLDNCIIVDPVSFPYLDGSVVDYEMSLAGDFFNIKNPNAKTTCGCGESFGI